MNIVPFLVVLINPYVSLIISMLGYVFRPQKNKTWLFLFTYFVFVAAYCINTTYSNDLNRYYLYLDICKNLSLYEVIIRLNDGLLLENFIYWFFSHLGVYQLMPAVSAATVLGIAAYIAGDCAERTNCLKGLYLVVLFQLMLIPIFNLANNVRNIWAFSLITLGIYRDLVQNNRGITTILLYIVPCFLHMTGAVIVFARLLVPLVRRFALVLVCFIGILSTLITFAYDQIRAIGSIEGVVGTIIRKLVFKAYIYLQQQDHFSQTVGNSRFELFTRPVVFIIAICIAYFCYKRIKDENERYKDFSVFCFICCIIVLACSTFTIPAYWRFAMVMSISASMMLCMLIKNYKELNGIGIVVLSILCIAVVARFMLLIPYLSLRMNLTQYFIDVMSTNLYSIFLTVLSVFSGFNNLL